MYKFKLSIPVYDATITFIIDDEIEKVVNKYVKRLKWDDNVLIGEDETIHGYAVDTPSNGYYIFYKKKSLTANCIVHEISHLVDFILEFRGIELVGESRSYLMGHITDKFFDFIIKNDLLVNKWLKKQE